ncbi:hypothetical protein DVA67_024360 [Solirubrobacter sp. CPCC 204708]|nr:hypothetical protein [Solirubrobacter deserti]
MIRRTCVLPLMLAACLCGMSDVAGAADPPGTYVVSMCSTERGPVPLSGWRKSRNADWMFADTCGTAGGSFGLTADGMRLGGLPFVVSWLWDAPEDLTVAALRSYGFVAGSGFWGGWRVDGHLKGFGPVVWINPR